MLAIAASKNWTIETSDVKSAFLQGRSLDRQVIIKPPKEANVEKGKLWELKVALYGLDDASLQFFFKCKEILIKLGCVQSTFDPAFFMKYDEKNQLIGLVGLHVDDFIHAGSREFKETVSNKLELNFKMGKTEQKKFKYVGYEIEQDQRGVKISQQEYADNLEIFDVNPKTAKDQDRDLTPEERSILRKVAGQIGWLARETRPDLAFAQVEMSTKFVKGKVRDLIQASKVTRRVKQSQSHILIKKLGPIKFWYIELSTDASLSNLNESVHSTGAYVILLCNESGDCVPISWRTGKIKRIVDSTLECECLSLADGLKQGIFVRELLEEILRLEEKSLPLKAIVDNKSTVDAIHSTAPVEDKKLRRDVAMIKQMLNSGEVTSVSWCPGKDQLADPMTKRTAAAFNLMTVFQTGTRK